MSADVVREFLVSLGYRVDASSQASFTKAIAAATMQAKLLGDAIEATARAVAEGVAAMARQMEQLYFSSQRVKASAENIKAFQLALAGVGGSADGALNSLESIARFMRNNPAGEGFIRSLGVETRDASGALRDMSGIATDLGKRLGQMQPYLANAYGNLFGLDERDRLALEKGLGDTQEVYKRFVAAAHLDMQKAAADSNTFMQSLRMAGAATGVLYDKVIAQLAGPLSAQLNRFTAYLVAHYDQIIRGLEAAGKVVIWFMDTLLTAATRAGDAITSLMAWFDGLDIKTQRFIEAAAAMLVAWRLLSRGFMTSSLGVAVAGLTALLLLLEDYSGWRSGKRSLIDWSLFDNGIQKALGGFKDAAGWMNDLVTATVGWEHALEAIAVLMAGSWLTRVVGAFAAARTASLAAAATSGAAGAVAGASGLGVGAALAGGYLAWTGMDAAQDYTQPKNAGWANLFHNMAFDPNPMHWTKSHGATGPEGPVLGWTAPRPGGAGAGGAQTNAAHAMDVLMGLGWSRNQAAGMAANLNAESGLNASRVGDSGQAYGMGQWHPDRQANFAKWAGHDIHGSSADEQLRFMDYELRQGAERMAGKALMLAQSARDAGMVVSSRYERPRDRDGNMLSRGAMAEQFAGLPLMRSPGVATASNTTTNAPTANMTTTIHVDGSRDPRATADAITAEQDRVGRQAARNLRGAIG